MKKRKEDFYEEDFYEDEEEIDLVDLLFTLTRRWKLITLVALPIFLAGVFFALTRPTVYKAETTLMVSSGRNFSATSLDSGELTVNQKLATTYVEVAKSKIILKRVIGKFDLEETPEELAKKVKIEPVEDTELLKLSYTNGDGGMAAAVINEIGAEFISRIREVMNFQNLKVVEKAEIPDLPMPKKRGLIVAISFVLAAMGGVFVAFLVEFFHSKVRKPKEIEGILGCPMLGVIPDFNIDEKEERDGKK